MSHAETAHVERVGADLARSWLLVNGARPEDFERAMASAADAVVFDIEDSVAPSGKEQARRNVVDFLQGGRRAWVRINGYGTQWWEGDCEAIARLEGVEGVLLAMVETSEHVQKTAEKLARGQLIVAMVETARGMMLVDRISQSRNTFRIAFGSGDFRRDTGMDDDPMALAHARSMLTIASRAAGLPGPIDGPAVGALGAKLATEAEVTSRFGMRGKICLMPEQCGIVNEVLAPSVDDITWARGFLQEFEEQGREIRSGSDTPKLARAERVLQQAAAFSLDQLG